MSLPSFPVVNPPIEREDAVNQILSSIAMEELGLSHILNAEGEKLQYILGISFQIERYILICTGALAGARHSKTSRWDILCIFQPTGSRWNKTAPDVIG